MFESDPNDFNNNSNEPYPFVKELSYSDDIRKIKITGGKGMLYALYITLSMEVICVILGLTLFADIKPLKILFCIMQLPYMLIFLFSPADAICKYDYTNKTFVSYITPLLPIPYTCFFSNQINFYDIEGFFLSKSKNANKKYFKVGVRLQNGQEIIIYVGQDASCSCEFRKEIDFIPFILRKLLKPGEQNII